MPSLVGSEMCIRDRRCGGAGAGRPRRGGRGRRDHDGRGGPCLPEGSVGGAGGRRRGTTACPPRRRLMPELPEVETVRRRLLTCLPGLLVREVIVNDATVSEQSETELRALLAGRRVVGLRRRGKYLIVDLSAVESTRAGRR